MLVGVPIALPQGPSFVVVSTRDGLRVATVVRIGKDAEDRYTKVGTSGNMPPS